MKTSFLTQLLWVTVIVLAGGVWDGAIRPAALRAQDATNEDASPALCSFNIQFLGQSTRRDHAAHALMLRDCDVVVVQELVAPPFMSTSPDGNAFRPDAEAATFFHAMTALGFADILSVEDTATGARNHLNSTATEWWVVFYKVGTVEPADGRRTAFVAEDRTDHEHYERFV